MKLLRRLVVMGWVGILASPAFGNEPPNPEVAAALKTLNDAFEKNDDAAIRRLMADQHVAVTAWGGVQTREAQIKTLPELKLAKYVPGPMTWETLGKNAVLVRYPLAMTGTFQDRKLPERSEVVAVWLLLDGTWKEIHYQETPVPAK